MTIYDGKMLARPQILHTFFKCLPVVLNSLNMKPFGGSGYLYKLKRHDSGTGGLIEPIKYSIRRLLTYKVGYIPDACI